MISCHLPIIGTLWDTSIIKYTTQKPSWYLCLVVGMRGEQWTAASMLFYSGQPKSVLIQFLLHTLRHNKILIFSLQYSDLLFYSSMHGFMLKTITLFLSTSKAEFSSYCNCCKLHQMSNMFIFKPEDQPKVTELSRRQKEPILSVGISNTIVLS